MSIKVLWVNKIFSSLFPENFLLLLSLINRLENPHIFYLIYINSDNNKRIHLLCVHAKSIQLCLALCCPVDSSPPGSSVHGILKARILEWVAISFSNVQFSSVAQSCPTLCNPMNRSTPGLPVHHQLPEFTQTHVHQVSDAIQPSHPLSSPSPPAPNPSQHQSFFQ